MPESMPENRRREGSAAGCGTNVSPRRRARKKRRLTRCGGVSQAIPPTGGARLGGWRASTADYRPAGWRAAMTVIAAGGTTIKPGSRGSASRALTWSLGLFLLLNAFALNSVLKLVSPPAYSETVLNHTSDVLHAEGCDDSWGIMAYALQYAQAPHTTPLYTEIFFNRKLKFQYPPSSLFAIAGMLRLAGPDLVRTSECVDYEVASLNDVLGWIFILISALSAAVLLERGLRQ